MFVEHNSGGYFLVKKVGQKKISTKMGKTDTIEKTLTDITQKEYTIIIASAEYQNFENLLHNKISLEKTVFQSLLNLNAIELSTLVDKNSPFVSQSQTLQHRIDEDFPIEFIYHSNNIEGSKIPKDEIRNILQEKKVTYKVKNEIQEVKNSINSRTFLQKNFLRNISNIKKLYHILTKNLLQENGNPYPRGFKKIPIVVNNETTVDPKQVEQEIWKLISTVKQQKRLLFPFQLAFDFHLRYEQIHPFENGNGRTGRLLMNKILMQHGMLPMIIFKENKTAYFNAIKKASESLHGKKVYYTFMIEQYQKSLTKTNFSSLYS